MFNIFGSPVPQIDTAEVKKALEAHKNFILLDVRTNEEFGKGKIAGSINLPLDQVSDKILTTIPDKNAIIYIVCLSGSRSEAAARIMMKLGYNNIFNVSNGMLAWRAKGFKVS